MGDYDAVVSGALKLKGKDGKVKKKDKKKKKSKRSSEQPMKQRLEAMETSYDASEPVSTTEPTKTEAERKFDEIQRKRVSTSDGGGAFKTAD
ncbi:hypothetical protein H4R34_006218 [Dimargaris verticillata]|uniref:Uncharacterized protein n=1 Tax=Dimargaris verticillata TaxID=2761393 RepID=A0A9W8E8P7_9FUNG|nr:hypothetical protein H4R34_006218 [Dimargaris verticillata]